MLHAIARLRRWHALCIVAVLFGAGTCLAYDYYFDDQVKAQRLLRRLKTEDDGESIRQILLYLANPPDEGENVAQLFSGWGQHGEFYDQAVNEMVDLLSHPHSRYSPGLLWELTGSSWADFGMGWGSKTEVVDLTLTAESARALQDVVARDDALLRAVFARERNRMADWRMGTCMSFGFRAKHWLPAMHESLLSFSLSKTGKFSWLLVLSGWFQRPAIFLDCRWETVDDDWINAMAWLERVGPYSYYDEELDHFVVDEAAMAAQIPVDSERQRWAYPANNKYLKW